MALGNAVFGGSASVYDLLYGDKDTLGEAQWIASQFGQGMQGDSQRVLEIGAGTGRHARALADLGFTVTAVDPSSSMLERAPRHTAVTYVHGDGRNLRLDESFDVVLALFHVVSYQTTLDDASAFFRTVSHHLDSGGMFGFDVWYSPAVLHQRPESRVLTKQDDYIRVTREAHPTEDVPNSRVDVHYTYTVEELGAGASTVFEEVHAMRHFTHGEIELLASAHGMQVVSATEFLTKAPPSRDTWGVWFLLQKA